MSILRIQTFTHWACWGISPTLMTYVWNFSYWISWFFWIEFFNQLYFDFIIVCHHFLTVTSKKIFVNEKKLLAERGFDPRTSGLWAQHASTAPLCSWDTVMTFNYIECNQSQALHQKTISPLKTKIFKTFFSRMLSTWSANFNQEKFDLVFFVSGQANLRTFPRIIIAIKGFPCVHIVKT